MPITSVLALAAAAMWGAADFMGGIVTRRQRALVTALSLQAVGLVVVVLVVPFFPGNPAPIDLLWGALAGICGTTGLYFLYQGLAGGQMNVIAPVTAVTAAVTPVVVGLLLGEAPSALAMIGVAVAILAVAILGMHEPTSDHERGQGERRRRISIRGLLVALAAGLGFGGFFVLFAQVTPGSGATPLLAVRVAGFILLAAFPATWRGFTSFRSDTSGMLMMVAAGTLDVTANFAYLIAIQHGTLALTPVLASLYPVSTVLLARVVLHERLGRLHIAGIILAVGAITLITLGS